MISRIITTKAVATAAQTMPALVTRLSSGGADGVG
jgi:hypothetical protein